MLPFEKGRDLISASHAVSSRSMVQPDASLHGPQDKNPHQFYKESIANNTILYIQGYEADNPNIILLRLRSFTIGRPISDKEMLADDAQDRIAALVGVLEPFVSH